MTRPHPTRWLAAPVVVAVALAGCGAAPPAALDRGLPASSASAPSPRPAAAVPAVRDAAAIQQVLDGVSNAFLAGDPEALAPYLLDPDATFGTAWRERAANMADLPLASYHLRLDDSLPDLATDRVRERFAGDVQVVYAVEELRLEGFDTEPAAEDLFLTMVDAGDGWRVAGDRDAERLGLVSVDHLWDHGPVTTTVDGPVMALHHPDGPTVGPLLREARDALAQANERWPLAWPERVPIIVPRDEDELAELLHVTFDLSNFVAFATATPTGELGDYALTGSRVVLNPVRFLDRSSSTRQRILVHELIHVATRPVAGPMMPSWLDEGVAQALGERQSTTGTRLLDALATSEVTLPRDGQFTVGGRDRVFLSYQLAWSFVDWLRRRYSDTAVGDFYAAAGQGSIGRAGTEAWNVDRAAREAFGQGLDALEAAWRADR